MGIFKSKEEKVEKAKQQIEEYAEKYNLQDLDDETKKMAYDVASNLQAGNLFNIAFTLQGKTEEVAKLDLMQVMIQQNWIMINQMNKILQHIDTTFHH